MERITVVALVSLIAAGGCGEDDRLTKQEYIARGNALCMATTKKLERAGKTIAPGTSEAEFVREKVQPIMRQTLDALEALEPPKDDEREVDAMVEAGRKGLARLGADPNSIRAPEGSAKDPFADFNRRARRYGIRC
jgi:hypothetical protein